MARPPPRGAGNGRQFCRADASKPGLGYVCHVCGKPGHWKENCWHAKHNKKTDKKTHHKHRGDSTALVAARGNLPHHRAIAAAPNGAVTVVVQQRTTTHVQKTVNKQLRHYVLLFDVSSSMAGSKCTAMCNQLLHIGRQVLKPYDSVSIHVFDRTVRRILTAKRVREVDWTRLAGQIQSTGSGTALYDAVGKGLSTARAFHKNKRQAITELVVFTDGGDRHSQQQSWASIKAAITSPGLPNFHFVAMVVGSSGLGKMKRLVSGVKHAKLLASGEDGANGVRKVFGKLTTVITQRVTFTETRVAAQATGGAAAAVASRFHQMRLTNTH